MYFKEIESNKDKAQANTNNLKRMAAERLHQNRLKKQSYKLSKPSK